VSDEYIIPFYGFMSVTPQNLLQEYIEVKLEPESQIEFVEEINLSFDPD
jgi:hypothetical protein